MTEGSRLIVETLEEYGVQRVFGNPGTTELPLMKELPDSDLDYVLCLHEDVAVGAAAGYASAMRYHSDMPAAFVNLHVAPGLAHGLANVHGAKYHGAPVVVTAGNHATDFEHWEPSLAGDLVKLAEDFTKWSAEVKDVDALPEMLRRAFREALSPPTGPVFLSLPMDVTMSETDEPVAPLGDLPTPGQGDPDALERAADAIAEADSPVLVVGDGVARSGGVADAVALAEASGARVHGEMLSGEVNFPSEHPQWVSFLPPKGDVASDLLSVDTAVFLGCSSNATLWKEDVDVVGPDTTCVDVGASAHELGKNFGGDVSVLGDPSLVAGRLAELVDDRVADSTVDERLELVSAQKQMVSAKIESMDPVQGGGDLPTKYDVVEAMSEVTPDAFVVDEGVTSKFALLTRFEYTEEQYLGAKSGGLGYGLPATVGAALAMEDAGVDREVVGFIGDGSYLYYPQTIYTAVREGLDLTVVVPDNRSYRILKDNTMEIFGGEEDDYEFVGMDLPDVDVPRSARSYGANAEKVDEPGEVESALREAVERDGVDVLDVWIPEK